MADRHVVLVCPKIPPTRDGVGDYTYRLSVELARLADVTIVTAAGQAASATHCRVVTVEDWTPEGSAALWPVLKASPPTFINVQWVPFLWGRWGVNLGLPRLVRRLRRSGHTVVTTVHEPYVPFDMLRRVPMGIVQRLELRSLIANSAKVAVTISPWTGMLQSRFSRRRDDFFWLPVGSAIPRLDLSDDERRGVRRQFGVDDADVLVVVFNPRGAGKMMTSCSRAWETIRRAQPRTSLMLIGCDEGELAAGDFPVRDRVACTGYVDQARVSTLLSAADVCLTPYVDGVSSRRSSMMAVMEHGVPMVGTRGHLTDSPLFDDSPLVLTDVGDEPAFIAAAARLTMDAEARRIQRCRLPAFYRDNFSWPLIASRLIERSMAAAS